MARPSKDGDGDALALVLERLDALEREVAELRAVQGRTAEALGRRDLLAPPASYEQVQAALAAGAELLVLRDYKAGPLNIKAMTRLHGSSIDHGKILAGVASGGLCVSIVQKAA